MNLPTTQDHATGKYAWLAAFCLALVLVATATPAFAQDAVAGNTIAAAGGKLKLVAPADWKPKQPSIRMIEHELTIPAVDGDAIDGRLTMMSAGGSIKANLDRWKGQFKVASKSEESTWKWGDHKVTLLSMEGTFMDRRGPFAPATAREDYGMLGAVVELPGNESYFVKFYGPKATVDQNAAAFRQMLGSK